ncbi:MAG: ribonuclease Z [Bacteroidetes bacterium]|nr:MAG: ribonuclease Z [Bacteroidota bacterium]
MSERKFFALGTGSQAPTRTRNQNGYFLRWDEQGILFDPGEGTQRQMIYSGVSANSITKIFISHFHGDHCLGLAGVLQRLSLDNVPHPVEVYFPAYGIDYFRHLSQASVYYGRAEIIAKPFDSPGVLFENDRFIISTLPLDHTVECWGFRLQEKDGVSFQTEKLEALGIKGPMVGQLKRAGQITLEDRTISLEEVTVQKKGQIFSFVLDTRPCSNAIELASNADMLLCEATFLNEHEKEAREYGHMTAAQAATIADEAKARLLLLTHFSQRYTNMDGYHSETKPIFENVVCLNDGDIVEVPSRNKN